MAKLLGIENIGGRIVKDWLHTDASGRDVITTETVEDVEPVFRHVKRMSELPQTQTFRYRASIPATLVDEVCRRTALEWGCSRNEVFRELMQNKTDRAKRIWRMLTDSRDYRKLQRS